MGLRSREKQPLDNISLVPVGRKTLFWGKEFFASARRKNKTEQKALYDHLVAQWHMSISKLENYKQCDVSCVLFCLAIIKVWRTGKKTHRESVTRQKFVLIWHKNKFFLSLKKENWIFKRKEKLFERREKWKKEKKK